MAVINEREGHCGREEKGGNIWIGGNAFWWEQKGWNGTFFLARIVDAAQAFVDYIETDR